ncbi:MAG: hypothetical protein MJZ73_04610 [Bacteroidaceae bacterium]|nr:hypothetical protein [Bacteroidaceae bacterium]
MRIVFKSILAAFLILGAAINAQAQNPRLQELQEASERLYGEFRELTSNKNYAEAIVPIKELICILSLRVRCGGMLIGLIPCLLGAALYTLFI